MEEETKKLFIEQVILLVELVDEEGLSELIDRIYLHGHEIGTLKANAKINQINK